MVHVHNFFQFVTPMKRANHTAEIVLHMHCDWLDQLDRTLVERQITRCGLIIGVVTT